MKYINNFTIALFLLTIAGTGCQKSNNSFSPRLIPIQTADKWGYVTHEGKYEINPQFTYAEYFADNIALVANSDKYGFVNDMGKYVINPQYKYALSFSEGLACVVPENGKIKYIDKTGNIKFELQDAEYAGSFHNGLAKIIIKDKCGFVDNTGTPIINPQFKKVLDFTEGYAAFMIVNDKEEELWGFIDKTGKIKVNAQFKSVEPYSDGLAVVSIDSKQYGFIDKTGKLAINPQFEYATSFFNGYASIKQGDTWGIINKEGKIIINPQFEEIIIPPSNGLIAVKNDSKWGYVDYEGKYQINPQFDKATNFIGEIAIVELSGKIGFINGEGKYVANPQFESFSSPEYYSAYGIGYDFKYVETEYFDIGLFIGKILSDKKIFGVAENTTVANISSAYKLEANDFYKKKVIIKQNENLASDFNTKDIEVEKMIVGFAGETYTTEDNYEYYTDYWGNKQKKRTGSTRKPNNEIKAIRIKAVIQLKNRGKGKGENLAENLKEAISKSYSLQHIQDSKFDKENLIILTHPANSYLSYIKFSENTVRVFFIFNQDDIQQMLDWIEKNKTKNNS